MQLSAIYIYPIKSLAGIKVPQAITTIRGLENDRRFMLTTPDGVFLTQRDHPQMALLKIEITGEQMKIWHKHQPTDVLTITIKPTSFIGPQATEVWGHPCHGMILPKLINEWFSNKLDTPCQLIYMTEESFRPIEEKHRKTGEIVSFADGYPYLLLGQSSMDQLNNRLAQPVHINRFRANLVFTGGKPHDEDEWNYFSIGALTFRGTKPCARCQVPNINQETAAIGKEPNKTLASYRRLAKNKIYFGMNVCWEQALSGENNLVRVGDKVVVIN